MCAFFCNFRAHFWQYPLEIIQDEIELVVSPFTLKFLVIALTKSLADLEKVMGEIEIPQELLDQVEIPPVIESATKPK